MARSGRLLSFFCAIRPIAVGITIAIPYVLVRVVSAAANADGTSFCLRCRYQVARVEKRNRDSEYETVVNRKTYGKVIANNAETAASLLDM